MKRRLPLVAASLASLASLAADLVFESPQVRVEFAADSTWRNLTEKQSGQNLLASGPPTAFATAEFEAAGPAHASGTDFDVSDQQRLIARGTESKTRRVSSRARRDGDKLVIGFEHPACELTFDVAAKNEAMVFALERISGSRPVALEFARVVVARTHHVGPRLAAAWDERLAVGLAAATLQSTPSAKRAASGTMLAAATQDAPGPKLEGASVALVAALPGTYRKVVARFAAGAGVPANEENGVPSRELDIARGSYWFLGFGEKEVDRVIACCRQSGFRQVMLSSPSWCASPGHYLFNTNLYPEGQASLRRTVARFHEAGIRVGMHCYVSKIAKLDPYVAPVPDGRFWTDRTAVLATAVGPGDAVIRTSSDLREWPGSSVAAQKLWEGGVDKHREVVLDGEIVRYASIGPEGKWNEFLGCQRGAWGTKAAAHVAGTTGRHYGVDGCINGYIIDQDTALLDEVADRLAAIFNGCDFDMVYFDGGEDVDRRRFVYYVSKFQLAAMSRFHKRPLVHMGTILTHHLWSSFTRSGTVDTYMNTIGGRRIAGEKVEQPPTVRDHIDKSVDYLLSVREDMIPGELGWFGIWKRGRDTEGLQLDEMEYLMARSLAYDAPISLQTSFQAMDGHPLTPGILEIARVYEDLRMSGALDEAACSKLRCKQKDFALVRADGAWQPVELGPVKRGDNGLRCSIGTVNGSVVAILWGSETGMDIQLADLGPGARVETIDGQPVAVKQDGAGISFHLGPRRVTLFSPRLTVEAVRQIVQRARAATAGR